MAKNKLSDLNNHLFAQLERLSDENMKAEDLETELKRSKAIQGVAKNIIDNARISLDAWKFAKSEGDPSDQVPDQLKIE